MEQVLSQKQVANDRIFTLLFDQDELTWQDIIYELINTEQMNPWDIDVSLIAQRFLETIKTLQAMDFRISGKIILASALLLKIKSNRLLQQDIAALDQLISGEVPEVSLFDETTPFQKPSIPGLIPKTPQPRKRKVSVYDLIEALEKALEVEVRRKHWAPAQAMKAPEAPIEISEIMEDVYEKIYNIHKNNGHEPLTFTKLVNSDVKEDKIFLFLPLLHLDNQGRIDLQQQEHFGEIQIHLKKAG